MLALLGVACLVVAAVTYEPTPTGWVSYTPLDADQEFGAPHRPWLAVGGAFLLAATAVAATRWRQRRRTASDAR